MSPPTSGRRRPILDTAQTPSRHDEAEIEVRPPQISAQGRTGKPPATNLVLPRSPLIGRDHEIAAIQHLLLQEQVGLLTLTGPGGSGKTRLAMQVATTLLDHFVDGVYFVSLAPIRDAEMVIVAVAETLGVHESGGKPLLEILQAYLRHRQILLVLDNFEQVLAAAPLLASLLAECRRLKTLVTSRATLHLYGEQEFPVPPLALPERARLKAMGIDLAQVAAVTLFMQRAMAAKPDFALTEANAAIVAEICIALDGLPLAIELAAIKIKMFPPPALLVQLKQRLTLLTGGAHDLPERQRTLRDEIAWSYDLLSAGEQVLFRRLAIFTSSFTLAAAQAIDSAAGSTVEGSGQIQAVPVLEGIASLIDKGLLRQEPGAAPENRFGMLETIREFGLEQVVANNELETLRRCHAGYYLTLAEEGRRQLQRGKQDIWMPRFEREQNNWRMALAWSQEATDIEQELRFAGALWEFWLHYGYLNEGRRYVEDVLARSGGEGSQLARANALQGAGALAWVQGDFQASRLRLEESFALAKILGDKWLIADVLRQLGWLALYQRDIKTGSALLEESLTVAREIGDKFSIATGIHTLGDVARVRGDHAQAYSLYEQSGTIFQEVGATYDFALSLTLQGQALRRLGDPVRAKALLNASLALWQELGSSRGFLIPYCLEELARLYASEEEFEHAACMLGAIETLRELLGTPLLDQIADMRSQLSDYSTAWAAGRAMSPEEAVEYALALREVSEATLPSVTLSPLVPSPPIYPASLTEREVEVLRLLAHGLSYAQIAGNLVISRRTVNAHISSIYSKLAVHSRGAATRFAREHHIV